MKRTRNFILIGLIAWAATASAQSSEEYDALYSPMNLRGNIEINTGVLNTTSGDMIIKSGGAASIIFNHTLAIGVKGSGFVGAHGLMINDDRYSLYGGYGGLLIEPILMPKKAIHVTFPVSVGAGEVALARDYRHFEDWSYPSRRYDNFLYVEPGVSLEVNMTSFMRFGLSGSYLLTNSVYRNTELSGDLDGLNIQASLKLGWFK